MPGGMSSAQTRNAAVLYEPLRRLPLMPRILRSATCFSRFGKSGEFTLLVTVPVVQIRIVRMPVTQASMHVDVDMRLPLVHSGAMRMLVMLVVHVLVRMRDRVVHMLVLVPLRDMQPHAKRHQPCGGPECGIRLFAQQ